MAVKFPDLAGNMREDKLGVVKSTYSFGTQTDRTIVGFSPILCLLVNHGYSFVAPVGCPFSPTCGRHGGSG